MTVDEKMAEILASTDATELYKWFRKFEVDYRKSKATEIEAKVKEAFALFNAIPYADTRNAYRLDEVKHPSVPEIIRLFDEAGALANAYGLSFYIDARNMSLDELDRKSHNAFDDSDWLSSLGSC